MGRTFFLMAATGVLAITTALLPAAASAHASSPALTTIILAPVPVSYPGLQTVISGNLQTRATDTTASQPIAGEQINLYFYGGCPGRHLTLVGTATSMADGSFTVSVTLPLSGAGDIYAEFGGDASYASVIVSRTDSPVLMPTRITMNPLPATITAYSPITVTGSVEVQEPDGTWLPADCAYVVIRGNSLSTLAFPTATTADGTFSTQLTAGDLGPFQASALPTEYSFNETAAAAPQSPAILPATTRISDFGQGTAPEIAQQGLSFTGQGEVEFTDSAGSGWTPLTLSAQLWFRAAGSTSWTLINTAPLAGTPFAGISGYLPDGKPAEGSWQIRTLATAVLDAAASPVVTVPVYVKTRISDIAVTASRGHKHLTGNLTDQQAGPLTGQPVRLSYRLPGSHRWHYLATATTGSAGQFRFPVTAGRWYRVSYPGHDHDLPVTTKASYLPESHLSPTPLPSA